MKKIFILTYILLSCIINVQGQTFNGFPVVDMSDATNYSLSEMYPMSNFPAGYFYCHFYITKEMDVEIDHCGSDPSESNMSLLRADGSSVALSTPYNYKACGQLGGLKATNLPQGDYYISNDFPDSNSSDYIYINIVTRDAQNPYGNRMSNAINVGSYSDSFSYSGTLNTTPMTNDYVGRSTRDVFYTFTLTIPMDITLSHCGSSLSDTYVYLLNSSGGLVASNNDHTNTEACSNTRQAYLKQTNLAAGVYYIVSEGYTSDGSITTRIEGVKAGGLELGDDHNYIISRTYTNDAGTQYLDNVQYFDGIGRPNQNIQRKITPSGKDLVTLQEYDAYGRESNAWLPGASTGDGRYVAPETLKAAARTLNADQNPCSSPVYEASSLGRVLEQYGPGVAWHNYRGAKNSYFTNISGNDTLNCVLYTVPDTSISVDTLVTVTRRGYYPTGSLHVTRTTDEDGNATFEFTDKQGQVVLTRQVVRNGSTKDLHDTYYIYDDYGNRIAVLPPLASDAMKGSAAASWTNANTTTLREYAYLYMFDQRNRCKAKRLPGAGWVYYIYDTSDRLVFTQNEEQRRKSPNEWIFSITDTFGRVCLTGICTNSYNALAVTPALNGISVRATRDNTTGTYRGYTISGVTLSNSAILSVNYYDDYDFLGKNNIPANTDVRVKYTSETGYGTWYGANYTAANKSKNEGMLTGTVTARLSHDGTILPSTNDLYSVMYYDMKGQLIQAKSNNHLSGGTEQEYFSYNFTGQTLKQKHVHAATGKSTQTEVYTYSYDTAGRLTTVKHKLNSGAEVTLANNTYDELGRLQTNQRNGVAALKSTYTYNVRSWIKSITSTLFSQTLYYNDLYGGNTVRYNGNISAMSWKLFNDNRNQTRGYKFTYDNLSRLTSAGYLENGVANDNFNTSYTYDKHGNMKTLTRRGNTGTSAYGVIDNLTMTYTGNQLTKVEDTGASVSLSASMDFKNGSNTAKEYAYNKNGNLTKDLNKGISAISYNLLNLPRSLTISNTLGSGTNTYTYAADGEKLSTVISGKTTDYCRNVIYENSALKRILIEGGYIEGGIYYFYLTDHLGNNRVVANASGTIVQSNHYYPYGMSFAEGTPTSTQSFKFGSKELDTQKGLNWYDFEARWKDDWHFPTPDPHSENYYSMSPYVYCGGNPILNIDPTGEDYWSTNDPDEIRRFIESQRLLSFSTFENFDYSLWKHSTDAEFVGGLTFNDETNMFHTSFGTIENGEVTIVGVSIKAYDVGDKWASIEGERGRWLQKASGRAENVYPEFDLLMGTTKAGWNFIKSSITSMFNSASTTNTFDASKSGFVQGGRKKEKMGKLKGNMPGNNLKQNEQSHAIAIELKLTPKQERQLHRLIGGQGYGYQEALMEAKAFFNK